MCCHCVLHKGAWAHSHPTPAHVGSTQTCPPNILALQYQWAQKVKQFNIIEDPVFPRWDVTEQRQCLVSTRQIYKIIERGGRDNRDWSLHINAAGWHCPQLFDIKPHFPGGQSQVWNIFLYRGWGGDGGMVGAESRAKQSSSMNMVIVIWKITIPWK